MPYSMCARHKRLHPLGERCPLCPASGQRRYPSKNTRAAGRYDYQWVKARAEAIRLQPWCSFCRRTTDLTGDHIQPLAEGGTNTPENIRVLCRSCNTRRENARRKGRHY
ncbi:HNH endonuclease [Streptomyces sp. ISL-87]|nr:HNH endonuclease [Streptomyces sp. ISL-21]MBT2613271.1 HNH endonuclease [Streptomyces sp. ISL-87]